MTRQLLHALSCCCDSQNCFLASFLNFLSFCAAAGALVSEWHAAVNDELPGRHQQQQQQEAPSDFALRCSSRRRALPGGLVVSVLSIQKKAAPERPTSTALAPASRQKSSSNHTAAQQPVLEHAWPCGTSTGAPGRRRVRPFLHHLAARRCCADAPDNPGNSRGAGARARPMRVAGT